MTQPVPATKLELATSEPDPTALGRLAILFRHAEGAWAVGVFESETERRRVDAELRQRIAPIEMIEISLLGRVPDPLPILQEIAILEGTPAPVVEFTALGSGFPDLFGYLDLQREVLARFPHRLLLWASESEYVELARRAPNFCSRLSGVFQFPGGLAPSHGFEPRSEVQRVVEAERFQRRRRLVPVAREQDRPRWIEHMKRRIEDLAKLERPSAEAIGDSWYDLGGLLEAGMPPKWREAEAAYVEAARFYAVVEQLEAQAEALLQAGRCALRGYAVAAALGHLEKSLDLIETGKEAESSQALMARALEVQSRALAFQGRLDEASVALDQALAIYRRIGDRRGEADSLRALGDIYLLMDRLQDAENAYNQVLSIYREIKGRLGEANTLQVLGSLYKRTGELRDAEDSYGQALKIYREVEDRLGEANALQALGDILTQDGRLREGGFAYGQAQAIYRETGSRLGEANTLRAIGALYVQTNRLREGEAVYHQALAIYRGIGDRLSEAGTLDYLACAARAAGNLSRAVVLSARARTIFAEVNYRFGQVVALADLARSFQMLKDPEGFTAAALLSWYLGRQVEHSTAEHWAEVLPQLIEGFDGTQEPSRDQVLAFEKSLENAVARCEAQLAERGEGLYDPLDEGMATASKLPFGA